MHIYLEAQEQVDIEQEAEFVRFDVTNKTQAERDAILVLLKDFMVGITCKFSKHTCYHEEGNRLCESVEV